MLQATLDKTVMEPRPYQERVVTKALKMFCGEHRDGRGQLERAARSVMVEAPTGAGKTPMGMLATRYMQDRFEAHVGWVAMRRNLLAQAAKENEKLQIGARVNYISMFNTRIEQEFEHLLPQTRQKPLIMVVDEAQHDAANTMQALHNTLQPDWILGLSAFPHRTDSVKLCFEKVVRDAGIHQLVADGYLSKYDHYTIPNWDPVEVADHYAADPQRWGKSLVFFLSFEQCQRWRARMEQHGLAVDVVTGSTDREAQVEDLIAGRVVALANMAVLTEGFNYPDLQTVWVRDSWKGTTIQMGGRVFRKADDPRLLYKQVVQSKNTGHPMIKTVLPHHQLVWQQDRWLTLQINPKMEAVSRSVLKTMAALPTAMPAFFEDRLTRKGRVRPSRF